MLTVIDNYDSFTYNLVQAFGSLGAEVAVWRNDEKSVEEVLADQPEGIIISPGPCSPLEAGISLDLIKEVHQSAGHGRIIPLLGVCLGHQALAQAFGGEVRRAPEIIHGKTSCIIHNQSGLFAGLEQGFQAGRYHSLMVEPNSLNADWEITAQTEDGLIMGLQHRHYPFYGLQFHPESILTADGEKILQAFLDVITEQRSGYHECNS